MSRQSIAENAHVQNIHAMTTTVNVSIATENKNDPNPKKPD